MVKLIFMVYKIQKSTISLHSNVFVEFMYIKCINAMGTYIQRSVRELSKDSSKGHVTTLNRKVD